MGRTPAIEGGEQDLRDGWWVFVPKKTKRNEYEEGSRIDGELFLEKSIRNNYCVSMAARGQVVKEHGHGVIIDSAVPGVDIIEHMF
jgi:hypothetical protein